MRELPICHHAEVTKKLCSAKNQGLNLHMRHGFAANMPVNLRHRGRPGGCGAGG